MAVTPLTPTPVTAESPPPVLEVPGRIQSPALGTPAVPPVPTRTVNMLPGVTWDVTLQ
ncbi:hypothetical protein ACQYWY_06235 [Comamonas sediminis]|uniref:hypothetical protein n=1 Tax=Comamonas sediminis TaxID=1783360 RepID=UPI003D2911E0